MTKENLFIRVLGSCETMANVSVICTDKTGILTQNAMTVVAGSIGIHAKFVRKIDENPARAGNEDTNRANAKEFVVDMLDLNSTLTPKLVELLNDSIAINSTAFEHVDSASGATVFIGSKTETALLKFARNLGWANHKDTRDAANVVLTIPFSSERRSMGCVVRLPDGVHRLFMKGASEVLTQKSTRHVIVYRDQAHDVPGGTGVETAPIGKLEEDNISRTITFYASQTLSTIAFCYRDFRSWPPKGPQLMDEGEVTISFFVKIPTTDWPLAG
jgi:Ca2+-transporting ATPase